MKTVFFSLIFLLTVACNTHVPNDGVKSGVSEVKMTDEVVGENFNQSPNYKTNRLTLIYPNQNNLGWVTIEGRDAEKLYDTLRVKPEQAKGTQDWNPGDLKRAQHVSCYRQTSRQDEGQKFFGCTIYLNYRNGTVEDQVNAKLVKKGNAQSIVEDYRGSALYMSAQDKIALITLRGIDAKALYRALDIPENLITRKGVDFDHKQGQFECFHELDKDTYECIIKLDYKRGTVITES